MEIVHETESKVVASTVSDRQLRMYGQMARSQEIELAYRVDFLSDKSQ